MAPPPRPRTSAVLPVTVVIPAYNRSNLIGRAVRSALRQAPAVPAEVIVVDDHSEDDTAAAAAAAGARVIRHERNRGEGGARNTAIRSASHEWIALLDSDDEWLTGHLAALWPHRDDHVLVSSTALARSADRTQDRLWGLERDEPLVLGSPADVLRAGNAVVASSAMVRRDVVLAVGGFDESLRRGADLDLWLRVLEHGRGFVSPEITVHYHLHDDQVSDDRSAMWAAHRRLLESYGERPWCTSSVRRSATAVLEWDELRAALARSDVRSAAIASWHIARDPIAWQSVAHLLFVRRRMRQRSADVQTGGA